MRVSVAVHEVEILQVGGGVFVGKMPVNICERDAVKINFVRRKFAVANRVVGRAFDNAFKGRVPFGGVIFGELCLKTFQTNILALDLEVHNLRGLVDSAVKNHVNHWRGNFKIAEVNGIAVEGIFAGHAA